MAWHGRGGWMHANPSHPIKPPSLPADPHIACSMPAGLLLDSPLSGPSSEPLGGFGVPSVIQWVFGSTSTSTQAARRGRVKGRKHGQNSHCEWLRCFSAFLRACQFQGVRRSGQSLCRRSRCIAIERCVRDEFPRRTGTLSTARAHRRASANALLII